MLHRLRSKMTYANVMATIAVFLALGGGAIAAKSLKRNSVGTKQLKAKAVVEGKIGEGAVTNGKLADNAVTAGKLTDGAVVKAKIAGSAVDASKIENGAVGLGQSANSLHQRCQAATIYITGACVDSASQSPTTGDDYIAVEQNCQARSGRLASAPELSLLVRGGFGTIPTPLFSWAMELTDGVAAATIISNTGSIGSAAVATLHDYRCAFNPLG